MTPEGIIDAIGANGKTIGEHARRLYVAGLIDKKYRGKFVEHLLFPYGKRLVDFLKLFRNI